MSCVSLIIGCAGRILVDEGGGMAVCLEYCVLVKPPSQLTGLVKWMETEQILVKPVNVHFLYGVFGVSVPCPLMFGTYVRNC